VFGARGIPAPRGLICSPAVGQPPHERGTWLPATSGVPAAKIQLLLGEDVRLRVEVPIGNTYEDHPEALGPWSRKWSPGTGGRMRRPLMGPVHGREQFCADEGVGRVVREGRKRGGGAARVGADQEAEPGVCLKGGRRPGGGVVCLEEKFAGRLWGPSAPRDPVPGISRGERRRKGAVGTGDVRRRFAGRRRRAVGGDRGDRGTVLRKTVPPAAGRGRRHSRRPRGRARACGSSGKSPPGPQEKYGPKT